MNNNPDNRASIMIVDDSEISRAMLREMLAPQYNIIEADSGADAMNLLCDAPAKPDIVLLDILMPKMNGFEVMTAMKNDRSLQDIPIICITMADEEYKGLNSGAVDYISKPFDPDAVKLRVTNQIELLRYRHRLEHLVDAKAQELVSTKETMLETLANLIEYRSMESGMHIKRTKKLTEILITQMLRDQKHTAILKNSNLIAMIKASALHDIGKIGIPDNILLKPGKLTPSEFKIIERHTLIGSDIFKFMLEHNDDEYFRYCYDICRSHHENWDGTGYPDKLAGENIPLSARILSLVDVYDALVSKRCYKQALPHEQALDIIVNGSGTHFDPDIVDALVSAQEQIKSAMNQL